jgi:hypothetical protein
MFRSEEVRHAHGDRYPSFAALAGFALAAATAVTVMWLLLGMALIGS